MITVTFDANTLEKATRPERCASDALQADYLAVHAALKDGRIKGYFSQTYCTLEGIEKKDRPRVLGQTSVGSSATAPAKNTLNISITIRHHRESLNDAHSKAVQAALKLGLRALRGPARLVDGLTRSDPDKSFYAPDESTDQLIARRTRANEVATAIDLRGVGHAIAQKLGNDFNNRADVKNKLWHQGLTRYKNIHEQRAIERAIAEWSDGDSVASHVGYGIDFFCSNDFGKGAGGPSILSPENRAWLSKDYGVAFVTLSELVRLIP